MRQFPFSLSVPIIALATASSLLLAGCAAIPLSEPVAGYTCCNLRSDGGWISSNNVQGGDLVPAGEAIKLTSVRRKFYVYGTIGGTDFGLRDDSAATEKDTLRWIHRIVVSSDPRATLNSWPSDVRSAVGAGRVFIGMTREQVAMAIGYPSPNDTPDLTASTWRYWTAAEDVTVDLRFSDQGKLVEFLGKPSAVRTIAFQQ